MATEVYNRVPIKLMDGTDVTLKPLPIGRLKKFMKAWGAFKDVDLDNDETAAFDIYVDCSAIAIELDLKQAGKVKETYEDREKTVITDEYREYLEETLDMDTIFKIMEVCGGLKLNDPNLLKAVAEAQAGTN